MGQVVGSTVYLWINLSFYQQLSKKLSFLFLWIQWVVFWVYYNDFCFKINLKITGFYRKVNDLVDTDEKINIKLCLKTKYNS